MGLVGMLLIVLSAFQQSILCIRRADSQSQVVLAAALTGALAASLVFSLSAPILFQRYVWMPLALLIAIRTQQMPVRGPQDVSPSIDGMYREHSVIFQRSISP
jgi:hypothetical protein